LVVVGNRWPLAVSLAESGLLVVSVVAIPASIGITQLLAGLALGELAMRRPWLPQLACGCAAACAVGAFYLASRPDAEPVPTVLRQAVERCEQAGFGVTGAITEQGRGLDSVRRLAVLRIVQESLTNVMRHASPGAHVEVDVRGTPDHVEIAVVDDGAPRHRPD